MNARLVLMCIALCAVLLAGCDRMMEPAEKPTAGVPTAVSQLPPQVASTPAASKDGQAPIQGQVDPKEPAQRQAFETK
jgi:hypothetical protein